MNAAIRFFTCRADIAARTLSRCVAVALVIVATGAIAAERFVAAPRGTIVTPC